MRVYIDINYQRGEEMNSNEVNNVNALLGLDIGTTNISAVVIDIDNNEIIETYAVANDSKLETEIDFFEYNAQWIANIAISIVDNLVKSYPNVKSIGLTGQMHGFVYVSDDGQAVSPLYNWQDGRGNREFSSEKTYCREIYDRTGYVCNSGYAFATMFYNTENGLEPSGTKSFCSIMDYIVMILSGRKTPLVHISNAASFGLCNLNTCTFDKKAVESINLGHITLPEIAKETDIAGYYKEIPVTVAIGDNQASFFGSVKHEKDSVLVNVGTGSQVSVVSDEYVNVNGELEIRPYLFGKYLLSGSSLCGGRAYAVLEKFFSAYAYKLLGNKESQYETMNSLAYEAYKNGTSLSVSTLFCGTRKNPDKRGSIVGIDDKNFTPGNLVSGVLCGMVNELKSYFDNFGRNDVTHVVASGNAVKKNNVLQKILKDVFGMDVTLTSYDEEAAIGCALFSGIASSQIELSCVVNIIREKKNDE